MANGQLLVLGATSSTGKIIVSRALELGWRVTVYGRRTLPEHEENADIKTVEGQLTDEQQLRTAIRGQDVIISVIGPSGARSPTDVFVPAYKLILETMKRERVSRIIALSTFSAQDPADRFDLVMWFLTTAIWVLLYRTWKAVVDVAGVCDSDGDGIDWTVFRVGFLNDGPKGRITEGYLGDGSLGYAISRASIAEWTLSQAGKSPPVHVHAKPGIASVASNQ
ncbi:NmrA family protein [Xylariaceae sp. FL1272]|nr:NmrA family protein [Xylariaceae sp. FL1272]